MALAIQEYLSPQLDNVFIHLVGFHIEMALMKVFGKYIEESGGPYILSECGVIAQGSLKGFISELEILICSLILYHG